MKNAQESLSASNFWYKTVMQRHVKVGVNTQRFCSCKKEHI